MLSYYLWTELTAAPLNAAVYWLQSARRTADSPFVSMMLKTPLVQCIDSGLRQADSTCPLIAIWNLGFPSTEVPPSASMAQVEYSYYRRLCPLLQKATTFSCIERPPCGTIFTSRSSVNGRGTASHSVRTATSAGGSRPSNFLVFYVRSNNAYHMRCAEHV